MMEKRRLFSKLFGFVENKPYICTKKGMKRVILLLALVAGMLQVMAQDAFIGKQFIDVEATDENGESHALSEYAGKGKWVLLDFWASWCGPCRAEMPNVKTAYRKYHDKGFEIVGFSFDEKKKAWLKAINDMNLTWIHLSDLKGWGSIAAEVYEIEGIPDNLLIDPKGKIVAHDLRGEELQQALAKYIGE